MNVRELTIREAEVLLSEWGVAHKDRDAVILTALASRVPKRRIAELTGIARTTIDNIEKKWAE